MIPAPMEQPRARKVMNLKVITSGLSDSENEDDGEDARRPVSESYLFPEPQTEQVRRYRIPSPRASPHAKSKSQEHCKCPQCLSLEKQSREGFSEKDLLKPHHQSPYFKTFKRMDKAGLMESPSNILIHQLKRRSRTDSGHSNGSTAIEGSSRDSPVLDNSHEYPCRRRSRANSIDKESPGCKNRFHRADNCRRTRHLSIDESDLQVHDKVKGRSRAGSGSTGKDSLGSPKSGCQDEGECGIAVQDKIEKEASSTGVATPSRKQKNRCHVVPLNKSSSSEYSERIRAFSSGSPSPGRQSRRHKSRSQSDGSDPRENSSKDLKTRKDVSKKVSLRVDAHRNTVLSRISKINAGRLCSEDEKETVLSSLGVISHDSSVESVNALQEAADDVVSFLLNIFRDSLENWSMVSTKATLRIISDLSVSSEFFLDKFIKCEMYEKILDMLLSAIAPNSLLDNNTLEGIGCLALNSIQVADILFILKGSLCNILSTMTLKGDSEATARLSAVADKTKDANAILRSCRAAISKTLRSESFSGRDGDTQGCQCSGLIGQLKDACNLEDLASCAHLFKVIVLFSDHPLLRENILFDNAIDVGKLFLSTLRCNEDSLEDSLVKFWLVKRSCENIYLRNFLFQREGAILEMISILRAAELDPGDSLEILSPFSDDSYFFDLSSTNSQLIQHFGEIFQQSECDEKRRNAEEVLLIFAEGLKKSTVSSEISSSFVESGIIFILLNAISINDHKSEWRSKSTNLLTIILKDANIRASFLEEPLGILDSVVKSCDSPIDRLYLFLELLSVLKVVASSHWSHWRLFESDILAKIVCFAGEVQRDQDLLPSDAKTQFLSRSLHVLNKIADCEESCCSLRQLNCTFLRALKTHERCNVRELSHELLKKLYC